MHKFIDAIKNPALSCLIITFAVAFLAFMLGFTCISGCGGTNTIRQGLAHTARAFDTADIMFADVIPVVSEQIKNDVNKGCHSSQECKAEYNFRMEGVRSAMLSMDAARSALLMLEKVVDAYEDCEQAEKSKKLIVVIKQARVALDYLMDFISNMRLAGLQEEIPPELNVAVDKLRKLIDFLTNGRY